MLSVNDPIKAGRDNCVRRRGSVRTLRPVDYYFIHGKYLMRLSPGLILGTTEQRLLLRHLLSVMKVGGCELAAFFTLLSVTVGCIS
jgi:hypothetical protein